MPAAAVAVESVPVAVTVGATTDIITAASASEDPDECTNTPEDWAITGHVADLAATRE